MKVFSLTLFVGILGASAGQAAPVLYNINFTGTSIPTSGSFSFDATASLFSNFNVVWNGRTYDFTTTANGVGTAVGTCATPAPDASDLFNAMTSGCSAVTTMGWIAFDDTVAGVSGFHTFTTEAAGSTSILVTQTRPPAAVVAQALTGSGGYEVTVAINVGTRADVGIVYADRWRAACVAAEEAVFIAKRTKGSAQAINLPHTTTPTAANSELTASTLCWSFEEWKARLHEQNAPPEESLQRRGGHCRHSLVCYPIAQARM